MAAGLTLARAVFPEWDTLAPVSGGGDGQDPLVNRVIGVPGREQTRAGGLAITCDDEPCSDWRFPGPRRHGLTGASAHLIGLSSMGRVITHGRCQLQCQSQRRVRSAEVPTAGAYPRFEDLPGRAAAWRRRGSPLGISPYGGSTVKIALISKHTSPLGDVNSPGGATGGGQTVFVANLATELGRNGHQVTIYTRRDSVDVPFRAHLAKGVTVEHVPAGPARPLSTDHLVPYISGFARHLSARWSGDPPDIAHAHSWMSGLAALGGAAGLKVPVVQTYHALSTVQRRRQRDLRHQGRRRQDRRERTGRREGDAGSAERIRLERAIGNAADAVIATCADEVSELTAMGVQRRRISIVPCGVDVGRFRPRGRSLPTASMPRLVVLSRLVEGKGVDTAIEALGRVPDAELVVAGGPDGPDLDADPEVRRLRTCAEHARVVDRVTFLGRVVRGEVPALLRSADLVVSLPWYEPSGMVALEAMACGVPVVASGVGGNLDTVVDQVTGVHVPPRRPAETARAIRGLLADPTRCQALGIAGSDRARSRYSWNRIARETATIYQDARQGAGCTDELRNRRALR